MERHIEDRRLAIQVARLFFGRGSSIVDFEAAVDNYLMPDQYADACWALRTRGELDHLISWVWTFRR